MEKRPLLLSLLIVIASVAVLCSPSLGHDYMAPYFYLSGIYSPASKPVTYSAATDAEMDWLAREIKDKDSKVRLIAAGALGQANNAKAAELLLPVLEDKSPLVQMNAAMAFFHVKDPRAVEPLREMLADSSREGTFALFGLAAQGDKGIEALTTTLCSESSSGSEFATELAMALALQGGTDAIQWAVKTLKGSEAKLYPAAISLLQEMSGGNGEKAVQAAVADPQVQERLISIAANRNSKGADYGVTEHALELVGGSKDPRVQALLKEREKEVGPPDESGYKPPKLDATAVKKHAAEVRRATGIGGESKQIDAEEVATWLAADPRGVQELIKIVDERNPAAARLAVGTLSGLMGNPKVKAVLLRVLHSPKHPAYRAAVCVFARAGDLPTRLSLLKSTDPYAVREVISAVGENQSMAKYLIPLLGDPRYRTDAALALGDLKDPAAIDALIDLLPTKRASEAQDRLLDYGRAATNKMLPKLTSPDAKMRVAVAQLYFGNVKEPQAVEGLIALLSDKDTNVRRAAIQALVFQKDVRAAPHYAAALRDPDATVRKYAAHAVAVSPDPAAVDTLVVLLKDKDKYTRTCAAVALGQLGDARAADVLASFFVIPKPDEQTDEQVETEFSPGFDLSTCAIKAAGKLKEKRAVDLILMSLGGDMKMSVFDPGTEDQMSESREAKQAALKSITGQDFGYAFYRWMAWWIAQGNKPTEVFPDSGQGGPP